MSKHTTGPWAVSPLCLEHGMANNDGSFVVMAGDEPIAHALLTVPAKRGTAYKAADPVRDANARLIAAAPDLLKALHVCVAHLNGDIINTTRDGTLKAAMDAIAKGEGR